MEKINEILQKVTELYMKFGIKSVTMNDVARELGVSKKTLYNCVKDKEELVKKVIDAKNKKLAERIKEIFESNMNAIEVTLAVSNFISNHVKRMPPTVEYDLKKYYPKIYKEQNELSRANMNNAIVANMKRGIEEGLFRKNLIPEIIAKIQIHRMEASKDEFFSEFENYTIDELFKEVITYHLRGICSPKGLEFLEKNIDKYK